LHKTNGFTLIEAMVVIFMIACVSAFAAPGIMQWRNAAKLRGAAENLKGDLELAKLKAIQDNGVVSIEFYGDRYRIYVDNDKNLLPDVPENLSRLRNKTLPAGIKIDTDATSFGGGKYTRFFGRGTAINGTAVLVGSKGIKKKVKISMFGNITIEDAS
jgi:prepilin-type N-terminal cleavage/methylation domain-containing protein